MSVNAKLPSAPVPNASTSATIPVVNCKPAHAESVVLSTVSYKTESDKYPCK